jgi:hypothetical protein
MCRYSARICATAFAYGIGFSDMRFPVFLFTTQNRAVPSLRVRWYGIYKGYVF